MSPGEKKLVRVGNYMMTGRILGKGHFARVEEAVHGVLNVKVAVKIINVSGITDHYVKKNLKREALIMAKISHPNIVCLFETLETEKNYYIVTEIGSGGDLCTYVKSQRYGKLDERKSRPLARQLASAVGHLHGKGVVHRDLKMENILLDYSKEKIKLVDFGLSNFCKTGQFLRTHCGSPEYAAPELYVSGRRYGAEVDLWSLGVVFYGMIMGKLPFQTLHRAGVSREEKRTHLMEETRRGLTMKHQKALMDCSHLFRNLMPKMLNPNSKERISMRELQMHAWIYDNQNAEFPSPDEDWQRKIMTKISNFLDIPLFDAYSQILRAPYGPIGGIYNIEKLAHLISKVRTKNIIPHIDFRVIKAIAPHTGSIRPLTYTSRDGVVQNPDNEGPKRRPKTAEEPQIPNDLKATTNFQIRNKKKETSSAIKREISKVGNTNKLLNTESKDRSTSAKMMNFLNEKISRAFSIYSKRASPENELDSQTNAKSSPNRKLRKPSNLTPPTEIIATKLTDPNVASIAGLSTQNDTCSENSSVKQTARTRFIKYLCSPKNQRQTATKKPRPCTAPGGKPSKLCNEKPVTLTPKLPYNAPSHTLESTHKPPILSKYLNYVDQSQVRKSSSHQVNNNSTVSSKQSTSVSQSPCCSRDTSFTNSRRRVCSGIPSHTAMRAAIRKELAARSSTHSKSKA